jgi:hypothetical protein
MTSPAERFLTGNAGCLFALSIGFTTIGLLAGGSSLLTGADLNLKEEWGVFLFQALLVAAPFGALATARESARTPWLTAAVLTAMFWSLYVGAPWLGVEPGAQTSGLACSCCYPHC